MTVEYSQTRRASGATTLPGVYFTSEEIFQKELDRIFGRRWIFAGHRSRLPGPGSFHRFDFAGEQIVIVRDHHEEIHAYYNVCRHRGSRFCSTSAGRFDESIQCPYHAWTYSLDGRLIGTPNMTNVESFDPKEYPLHRVAVNIWEGLVFVNLDSSPEPFKESFSPILDKFGAWGIPELRVVHQTTYEVDANWKLLFHNYSECYHCPTVHPHLNRLTPYRDSENDLENGPFLGGPMRIVEGGESMTMDGHACAAPLPGVSMEDRKRVYYYTILPNLFLSLHPDYVLIHRAEPLGVDKTRIVCEWLFHPDAVARDDFDPGGAIEFWDTTNRQDWDLCEITQQGVSSRAYAPGPYSNLESQLAAFDREYLRLLGEPIP